MVAGPLIFHRRAYFHPLDLGRSRLKSWWNADTVSGTVVTWADMVGGISPTQGTSGSRPVQGATSFPGGFPGVFFDGVDDNLRVSSVSGLPITTAPGEIWTLVSPNSASIVHRPFSYGTQVASQTRTMLFSNASIKVQDETASVTAPTAAVVGGVYSTRGSFSGGNLITIGVNSDAGASVASSMNTGSTRTSLGASINASPSQFFSGYIKHVMVFSGVLSAAEAQKLHAWNLWDVAQQALLPATNPYRLFRP